MIGTLRGTLISRQAPVAVIECAGVGYEVEMPTSAFFALPARGEPVFIHAHLVVRENLQALYGFQSAEEKTLFRALLGVTGVGAKMALAILSGMTASEFAQSVRREDTSMLVKIPGVGKKTAERLIIDMRDKIEQGPDLKLVSGNDDHGDDARGEAIDALVSLGYKPGEVRKLLGSIDVTDKSAEDIIRMALKQAAS